MKHKKILKRKEASFLTKGRVIFLAIALSVFFLSVTSLVMKSRLSFYDDPRGFSVKYPAYLEKSVEYTGLKVGNTEREALFYLGGRSPFPGHPSVSLSIFKYPKNIPNFNGMKLIVDEYIAILSNPKFSKDLTVSQTKVNSLPTTIVKYVSTSIDDGSHSQVTTYFFDAKETVYEVNQILYLDIPEWQMTLNSFLLKPIAENFQAEK